MDLQSYIGRSILVLFILILCGCAYQPKKITHYDQKCRAVTQRLELSLEPFELAHDDSSLCSKSGCRDILVDRLGLALLIVPVSAVVSGSVAAVGNAYYWLDDKNNCVMVRQELSQPELPLCGNIDNQESSAELVTCQVEQRTRS